MKGVRASAGITYYSKYRQFAMEATIKVFESFIASQGLSLDEKFVKKGSLKELIISYFHLFQEVSLKFMVTYAVDNQKSTSGQTAGVWTMILDTMRTVIEDRKVLASENIQNLVNTGMRNDNRGVDRIIITLLKDRHVDYLLMDILTDTVNACEGKAEYEEQYYMLTYIVNTIEKLMARSEVYKPIVHKQGAAKPATISSVEEVTTKMDATTVIEPLAGTAPVLPPKPPAAPTDKQAEYIKCGEDINNMIHSAKGDMPILKGLLHGYLTNNTPQFIQDVLLPVITDNIQACQTHQYVNKEKLLSYMKTMIDQYLASTTYENVNIMNSSTYHAPQFLQTKAKYDNSHVFPLSNILSAANISTIQHQLSSSGQMNNKKKKKQVQKKLSQSYNSLVQEVCLHLLAHHYVVIEHFIPSELVQRVYIEASKLSKYYEESEIWVGKQADVGAHLSVPNIRGDKVLWLCGGHQLMKLAPEQKKTTSSGKPGELQEGKEESLALMPLNNSEVKLFEPEQKATTAPEDEFTSNQHMAVEGVSRTITTHGEIEPCKLTIKAQSPIKRFMALKDLILQCDTMVSYLRTTHPLFENIYERSDVMLAIYPGNGARFANHIDNTTQDGRRLTLVVYLNENWQDTMGGALRVTEPAEKPIIVPKDIAGSAESVKSADMETSKELEVGQLASSVTSAGDKSFDIFPLAGRVALFFSSSIAHEVLPTFNHRYALTIWYYDRYERRQAIQNANEKGSVHKVSHYDVKYQVEAKDFIARLLKNHDKESGTTPENRNGEEEEPSEEELKSLCYEVQNTLSPEAIEIVASITGAPSVDSFKTGFPLLTTKDLQHMRALFRKMGLQ